MDDGRQVMAKAHVAEDVGKSSDMSVKTGSLKRKLDEGIFNDLEFSLKIKVVIPSSTFVPHHIHRLKSTSQQYDRHL
jgi:hypothetical protein